MAPSERHGSFHRRPYPYGGHVDENGCQMPVRAQNGEPWSLSYGHESDSDEVDYMKNPPSVLRSARRSDQSRQPRHYNQSTQAVNCDSKTKITADDMDSLHPSALAVKALFEGLEDGGEDNRSLGASLSNAIPPLNPPKLSAKCHKEWNDLGKDTVAPSTVDPEAVLQNMLDILCEHPAKFPRYAPVFAKYGRAKIEQHLRRCARDQVQEVCTKAPWKIDDLRNIGGDISQDNAAVYLHLMWLKGNNRRFWIYVGQADNVNYRISLEHSDPTYRKSRPSLHYAVFDPETMDDAYVIVADVSEIEEEDAWFFKNLLEMWGGLIFQTIRAKDLLRWLPLGVNCPSPGQHLNVALPLWQGKREEYGEDNRIHFRKRFAQLRNSDDPLQRDHFWQVVLAFNELRNSPDPAVREAYYRRHRMIHARSTAIKRLAEGFEVELSQNIRRRKYFLLGSYTVGVSAYLECNAGDTVLVQSDLKEEDVRHLYCHTTQAHDSDPAKRLALKMAYCDDNGIRQEHWLRTDGWKAAQKINTIVDRMDGIPDEISRTTSRRWFRTDRSHYYTK